MAAMPVIPSPLGTSSRRGSREEQIIVEICLPNQVDPRLSDDFQDLEDIRNSSDDDHEGDGKESIVNLLLMSAITPLFYLVFTMMVVFVYMIFMGLLQVTLVVGWVAVQQGKAEPSTYNFLITSVSMNLLLYMGISGMYLTSDHICTKLERLSYSLVLWPVAFPSMMLSLCFLVLGFVTQEEGDKGMWSRVLAMTFQSLALLSVTAFWGIQVLDYKHVTMTLK
ncbi:hypothetical protein HOP50_03g21410 [Chloropicon primus]|uniref:Uncharacterized protein n=1 Tax=Chloropicon primus TaxID=1764295 RepID=A0A5B8MGS0_9CHLO|nr:hypothetical protein A3770_03p21410 [Chloropicon primus]UPQ98835.1 hypothetical protein HOP50_03g21410 [Chloropicon primus]|eukprot:QDZ19623.1 hypothetical protein A3770_03p21410 [Chloropicon primus]